MDDFKKITFKQFIGHDGMKCRTYGCKPGKEREIMRRHARHKLKQIDIKNN